jgi:hypothetical protein
MHARWLTLLTSGPQWGGATYGNGKVGRGMSATIWDKSDWPTVGVCLALSGFGLSAVPFIGTKYGDWPEATALAIGLLPLVYIAIRMSLRFNSRLNQIEERLRLLEGGGAKSSLKV